MLEKEFDGYLGHVKNQKLNKRNVRSSYSEKKILATLN